VLLKEAPVVQREVPQAPMDVPKEVPKEGVLPKEDVAENGMHRQLHHLLLYQDKEEGR
jgi:hypothetical protein